MPNSDNGVVAVIPARYASTRFPGKPLAAIAGKPMIQWVYEQATRSNVAATVVATDDPRIAECVAGFGGRYVMTAATHATGTDRIAEAIREINGHVIINIQGDEPLIPVTIINDLARHMTGPAAPDMATVAVPIDATDAEFTNPNVVKVVIDNGGNALYFSRAAIPHRRDPESGDVRPLWHWGVYAYRRAFLEQFASWPQSALERHEKLEQLRALENGARILVLIRDERIVGVDVPEDIEKVEAMLRSGERMTNGEAEKT